MDATISSGFLRVLAIVDLCPPGLVQDTGDGIPGQPAGRKVAKPAGSPQKYTLGLGCWDGYRAPDSCSRYSKSLIFTITIASGSFMSRSRM